VSGVTDFSLLSEEERADLERVRLAIAEGEHEAWKGAYRKGWRERGEPWKRPPPVSPPLSLALIAHFAYLDRLINSIRELDTASSEQRIRRSMRVIRRRVNGLG
jgi:hypothetical protein